MPDSALMAQAVMPPPAGPTRPPASFADVGAGDDAPPAKRGRGRPRKEGVSIADALESRFALAVGDARTAGVLASVPRDPGVRFDVDPGKLPDLSGFDLGMLADAVTAMISAGTCEAYGRRRAFDALREVYGRDHDDAERARHVAGAHALLIHDGHKLALSDMADRRFAGAVLAHRLDQIFVRAMAPDVFSKAAGVALKAATLRAKLHGIDVDAMRIDIRADVQVEHSDPIRDAIVQRLIAAKEAAARARAQGDTIDAEIVDAGPDDVGA